MGPDKNDLNAVDVTALMQQVRLEVPLGTVTVQGVVDALRSSPKDLTVIYGDLRGFDQSIMSFRCAATAHLRIEEPVVLRGTLIVKRSTIHRGFDLELVGNRVGSWAASEPLSANQAFLDRGPKLSLERLLAKTDTKRLVLIGTKKGIDDAKTGAGQGSGLILDQLITSTTLECLTPVIAKAAKEYDGLCLVRGGGDLSSFATWNDSRLIGALIHCGKPFYTALGHTSDMTLADKYADESFSTPSILGSACKDAWHVRMERQQLERRLDDLSRANRGLKTASENAKGAALDSKMALLQRAIDEFQNLKAAHGSQTGPALQAALDKAIRDFSQQIARKLQFHTWRWLCLIFLLGVVLGGFSFYMLNKSMYDAQSQTGSTQLAPSDARPAEGRNGKTTMGASHRRHSMLAHLAFHPDTEPCGQALPIRPDACVSALSRLPWKDECFRCCNASCLRLRLPPL